MTKILDWKIFKLFLCSYSNRKNVWVLRLFYFNCHNDIGFLALLWQKSQKLNFIILAGWLVSFGFVFPLIAAQIEELSVIKENEIIDSYEMLYTILYFPIYWGLGIIELIALLLLFRSKKAIKRHEMKLRIMRFRHFPKKTNFEKPYWKVWFELFCILQNEFQY